MSGSSPESGEFAARQHLKLGFAFTTVPLASKAARYYREQAAACGWEPVPDDVLSTQRQAQLVPRLSQIGLSPRREITR